MIQKIKTFLQKFSPHSKVFIIGAFSAVFLILIFITISIRVSQEQESRTTLPTPAPRVLVPGKDFVEGQISVKFKDGLTDPEINNRLARYNAQIKSTISGINTKVVTVPVGQEDTIRKQLVNKGIVKYAELDHISHANADPNDSYFGNQYALKNTGQVIRGQTGTPNADIKIEPAWEVTKGTGVKVAVLDTGIDLNHPEFSGKIVLQKIFVTNTIDDLYGHGTHTAGILAANTNNNQGVAGVCPECQILVGKVLDDTADGANSGIASGITWAADNGAKVISMSLGGYDNDSVLSDAVNYAWNKGSVIVAAVGNDNSNRNFYPAAFPRVVSVGATDNTGLKWTNSNYGSWVLVAAPGRDVIATLPTNQNHYGITNYGYLSGTSMATPMVSGVVALIWATLPNATNQSVVDRLFSTADQISGTGTYWQKGRVNAAAAVGAGNITPTVTLGPTVTTGPTITLNPTATTGPTQPAPTFVCGGSPNNICNPTLSPGVTLNPTKGPTVTAQPTVTGEPILSPSVSPVPTEDCLDPRSTPEKIMDWVRGFLKKINDYIQLVMGNPQNPTRPAPPRPCIVGQKNTPIVTPSAGLSPTLSPGVVKIQLTARVAVIVDDNNLLQGAIKPDQILTGTYTYNMNAPNTGTNPNQGIYKYNSVPYGISVQGGGLKFETDPANVNLTLEIRNDEGISAPFYDRYGFVSLNNRPVRTGVFLTRVGWFQLDRTGTAISSVVLSDQLHDFSKWQENEIDIIGGIKDPAKFPSDNVIPPYPEIFAIKATVISIKKI